MTVNELIRALQTMREMGFGDEDVTTEGCYTAGPDILSLKWDVDGVELVTFMPCQEGRAERQAGLERLYDFGLLTTVQVRRGMNETE